MRQACNYDDVVVQWADAHRYSPAPRHRRRIIAQVIRDLDFRNCLDIGCAQPFLIEEILRTKSVSVAGCDISETVILSNKSRLPGVDFFVADISRPLTHEREYDLVVCSEVLEHVDDWHLAVKNISALSRRWLLITVPRGRVYPIDQKVGHLRHFEGEELLAELARKGFYPLKVRRWGFPVHSAYKYLINGFFRDKIYKNFSEGSYGVWQKIVAQVIYGLFFFNSPFNQGSQLIVLLEKREPRGDKI